MNTIEHTAWNKSIKYEKTIKLMTEKGLVEFKLTVRQCKGGWFGYLKTDSKKIDTKLNESTAIFETAEEVQMNIERIAHSYEVFDDK